MNLMTNPVSTTSRRSLVEELEARLEHGDQMIRRLEAEGADTSAMNRHWLRLLEEYKAAYEAEFEPAAA